MLTGPAQVDVWVSHLQHLHFEVMGTSLQVSPFNTLLSLTHESVPRRLMVSSFQGFYLEMPSPKSASIPNFGTGRFTDIGCNMTLGYFRLRLGPLQGVQQVPKSMLLKFAHIDQSPNSSQSWVSLHTTSPCFQMFPLSSLFNLRTEVVDQSRTCWLLFGDLSAPHCLLVSRVGRVTVSADVRCWSLGVETQRFISTLNWGMNGPTPQMV